MAKPLRGEIEVELGGEKRTLRLGIGELEELEDQLDIGLPEIFKSLATGKYRISQLRKILMLGLESGGYTTNENEVRQILADEGPGECQVLCLRLINVALGNEDISTTRSNDESSEE